MDVSTTVLTTHTREFAIQESLKAFDGDELAAATFVDKYALRDDKDNLLESKPDDMHWRIANELARIEATKFKHPYSAQTIFDALAGFRRIVAQGSPSYGIGNPYQIVSLSNCYVIPSPLDCYSSIMRTDEQLVQISKRRGGVGTDLSNLRPANTPTRNAARTSSGAVAFAHRYSHSIREVGQHGRRGALMLTLDVKHPEAEGFVKEKRDLTKITGANVSLRISDEFMEAVLSDGTYTQQWPVDSDNPRVVKPIEAKVLWDTIITSAHAVAEPGVLFWDTILRESPADCYAEFGFETICTNPCSEIAMSAYDSCRLFLLNAFGYVRNPFTAKAKFDWVSFKADAGMCQRLMDDLVDLEIECIDRIMAKIEADPQEESLKIVERDLWTRIREAAVNGRRTGTGETGLADAMAALGIAYTSDEGIKFVDEFYRTLKLEAYRSSVEMAKELGPFPVWNAELERANPFLLRIKDEDPALYAEMQKYGRRNIALLTTAPAGTVSILTRTTSGIEPLFLMSYTRRRKGNPGDPGFRVDYVDDTGDSWMEYKVYHPRLQQWMDTTGNTDVNESPWAGSMANELDWQRRVMLQATAQKHVDHAISSTINLPEDVSKETVALIYTMAWKLGCKGMTIYRDKCRSGVLVQDSEAKAAKDVLPAQRPPDLLCEIQHFKVKKSQYFVLISLYDGKPYEVFAGLNDQAGKPIIPKEFTTGILTKRDKGHYRGVFFNDKKTTMTIDKLGNLVSSEEGAITRLLSTSLRNGIAVEALVHQLEKVTGDMFSFSKCIARALKKYIPDGTAVSGESCPSCNVVGSLIRQEGCLRCQNCGLSKCG